MVSVSEYPILSAAIRNRRLCPFPQSTSRLVPVTSSSERMIINNLPPLHERSERDDVVPLGDQLLEARMSLVLVEEPHVAGLDGSLLLEDARAEAARPRALVAQ